MKNMKKIVMGLVCALALVTASVMGTMAYLTSTDEVVNTFTVGNVQIKLDEDTIVTHRIVDVIPDETDPSIIRFQTKGDANDSVDGSLVHYKNVIGTPVFSIPKLGYLANYIQKPPGRYIAISAGAIILLLVFLPDLFSDDDKSEKKKKKQNNERG